MKLCNLPGRCTSPLVLRKPRPAYVLSNEFSRERVRGIRERLGVELGGGVGGSAAAVFPGGNGTGVMRFWSSQLSRAGSTLTMIEFTTITSLTFDILDRLLHFRIGIKKI